MAANYSVFIDNVLAKEVVEAWREKHPATVTYWSDVEDAARAAILMPKTLQRVGKVSYASIGGFLWCQLPSGRRLAYCSPSIEDALMPWSTEDDPDIRPCIHFWGVDSYTKRWTKLRTYGGSLVENIVQATARDVLAEGMLNIDAAGYSIVLTVHDEIVCEEDIGWGSLEEVIALVVKPAPWMAGYPLAAAGWEGARFRKQ